MERIQVLIEKLAEQKARGESVSQLLMTVQLLQQELLRKQQGEKIKTGSKVAVVMPGFLSLQTNAATNIPLETDKEVYELELTKDVLEEAEAEAKEEPVKPSYSLVKPVVEQPAVQKPVEEAPLPAQPAMQMPAEEKPQAPAAKSTEPAMPKPEPVVTAKEEKKDRPHLLFDMDEEVPTLTQHAPRQKEVHEVIGGAQESLNDRLKQEKTELANVLKDAPIKDLRKGIGVNDKFTFINELFRGDEAMYDRSIKTINNFHILPEAEYWMNRELKVKLGWNDNRDVVQHFYQVVRRRFS